MVLTSSTMLPLGTAAPDFELPDVVSGKSFSLASFTNRKALLLMFICKHCPYVKHVEKELASLGKEYQSSQLAIAAISANDADAYPDDSPANLKKFAEEQEFAFPLLYDESQAVALAYTAACTPDFFLFDADRRLVYRGQLDESRPGNNKPVTGRDLRAAINALLSGASINPDQKPSAGCNIKWKPGHVPKY